MGMVGVGSIFGADGDIAIKSGLSNYYQLGALYKLKINGLLSVVAELGYRRESYLRGNLSAISNDSLEISSARYNLNIAQPNLGLRFNFDPKRGNVLGTYLEIGGGPSLLLWASSYTRTKVYQLRHTNEEYAQTQATRVSPLRGFNAIQWVGYARLGRGRFAVVGMYRLTPAVNKAKQPGLVLPEVSAGLQLAL
jgi:hypothetical protein